MTPSRHKLTTLLATLAVATGINSGGWLTKGGGQGFTGSFAWGGVLVAAQAERQSVRTATESAVRGLKDQIDRLPLGTRMTVGEYLDTVRGHDFLLATLQRAQMIGGPRQLGEGIVQVRLDVSGQLVADALSQVAATNQRRSPYSAAFVAQQSRAWSDRTFTATGSSAPGLATNLPMAASAIPAPTPPAATRAAPEAAGAAAGAVPDAPQAAGRGEIPLQAVDAAKRSAANGLLARVADVDLPTGRKARELVELTSVSEALTSHVLARPLKSVEARPGGEVRVRITIDRQSFFETFKQNVDKAPAHGKPTIDEAGWSAYREPVMAAIPEEIEGIALPPPPPAIPSAQLPAAPDVSPVNRAAAAGGVTFPLDQPPAWFFEQLDAGGSAPNAGSKLLTARAAEADALQLLGKQLELLELRKGWTLGDAARADSRFGAVLARGVERARVYRVEYFEDGSARVRVSTDTRYLWQDIVIIAQTGQ